MSAVIQEKQIETIFDHGVTDDELNILFYGTPEPYEEYVDGLSPDGFFVDIVRLYRLRNDNNQANKYLLQIQDAESRSELSTIGCCVAHF